MSLLLDDAIPEYAEIDNAIISSLPYSVSLWFKSDSVTLTQTLLWIGDKDVTNKYQWLMAAGTIANDPVRINATEGGSAVGLNCVVPPGFVADTWHHAGVAVTSNVLREIWFDGGQYNSSTVDRDFDSWDRVRVGYTGDTGASNPLSGYLAMIGLWNVALPAANMVSLAGGAHPTTVQPANLVACWPLFDTLQDMISGYHLTHSGTPTYSTDRPALLKVAPRIAMHHYKQMQGAA